MTELYRKDHRLITKRIIVRGTLVLDTPTCLGTGDADSPTDLPLLRDSLDDKYALLTGSSIAGALRNYLRERKKGYGKSDLRDEIATKLFGDLFSYKNEQNKPEKEKIKLREKDTQSSLIINDSISTKPIQFELRDGVKINSITRTATDKAKYDLELLQAGTEFPLCFELLIEKEDRKITLIKVIVLEIQLTETSELLAFFFKWLAHCYQDETKLLKSLIILLQGLEKGEIEIGMKKRRGFGHCHVKEWQVWYFNLEDIDEQMNWLKFEHWRTGILPNYYSYSSFEKAFAKLGIKLGFDEEDKRDRFTIQATFKVVSSLLIRSGQAETGRAPDVVHLKSHRSHESEPVAVLSGTSLAGVLRHRAERIIKTIQCSSGQNPECDKEPEIVQSIFGHVENKKSQASRLVCKETEIKEYKELVQTRIAIDRFTGGAYHGALFEEQPVFGGDETCVTIKLELRQPKEYEIGLLLLLIKDLWTSDLPVGGESSIGRGRLKGIKADLIRHHSKEPKGWTIAESNGSLQVMNLAEPKQSEDLVKDDLERFVKALLKELGKEV